MYENVALTLQPEGVEGMGVALDVLCVDLLPYMPRQTWGGAHGLGNTVWSVELA